MNDQHIIQRYLSDRIPERSGNTLVVRAEAHELTDLFRTLIDALPFISMFATDEYGSFSIRYVFGVPHENAFIVVLLPLSGTAFPSLAREFPCTALYERLCMTMFGLTAEGHPDPRTVTLHEENWPRDTYPMRTSFEWNTRVPMRGSGTYRFHEVSGEGIYEIPVGPVHAGIIEPGNFRFSVAGEEIIALEARLGWVHKGTEKLFEHLAMSQHPALAEHVSGDSSFAHSLAYCQAIEVLTGTAVPERARYLRTVFGELERLTMHLFDIGNICGNGTGFTFMATQGFRMTEELRRLSQRLAGNRFWRSINLPGGVTKDISADDARQLTTFLGALKEDFADMMNVADQSASLANRLQGTGTLSRVVAQENHATGVAARCVGIEKDVRVEYPYAAYDSLKPDVVTEQAGDVDARVKVRVREVYESIRLIVLALERLPRGPLATTIRTLPSKGMAVGLTESWRGEIAYAVITDDQGAIARVAVRDPSFVHWQLFPHMVGRDMVPDFPLINKSLNLSYTGNDL